MKNILIRSKDRTSGDPHNFAIEFKADNLDGKYVVKNVSLPNSFYNVNSSNNVVYFYETGASTSATIPVGNYTASSLATQLKTSMDAVSTVTYTITYSNISGKFTFVSSGNSNFEWGSNTANSARYLLGFNEEDTSPTTSQESTNVINLSPYPHIGIDIQEDSHPNYITAERAHSSIIVPLSVSFGSYQVLPMDDFRQIVSLPRTRTLNIRLIHNGSIVLNNSVDWEMLLCSV